MIIDFQLIYDLGTHSLNIYITVQDKKVNLSTIFQ